MCFVFLFIMSTKRFVGFAKAKACVSFVLNTGFDCVSHSSLGLFIFSCFTGKNNRMNFFS